MRLSIGTSVVEVDVEATRAAYARFAVPGPEQCGCCYCRNWAAQRSRAYPPVVNELLTRMGIKPGFETEVWQVPADDNRHFYSGWYPFVGEVVEKSQEAGAETVEGMKIWISAGLSYSVPWMPTEGCQELQFSCVVDWVLKDHGDPNRSID